jgi:thiamine pyrophosphate-dependent acetolactate synthase large subunit-like protein
MRGYEVIASTLAKVGVHTVFGLPGDGNMFIDNELVKRHGVRYVSAVREDGAVSMADAFARVSNELGVASVTHGPGLTNTVTALKSATRNRTPMLLMCGQINDGHNQFIDQEQIALAAGATFQRIRSSDTIQLDINTAVRRSRLERLPVVVELPVDIQLAEAMEPRSDDDVSDGVTPIRVADRSAMDTAVGIIASARRPVVVAGIGVARSGARDALVKLAAKLGAPLATTLLAKDTFHGEAANLGVCGDYASTEATEILLAADCLIIFGASLNKYTTSEGSLTSGKAIVQCDADQQAIERWTKVTVGLVGDAGDVANEMSDWLDELEHRPSDFCDVAQKAMGDRPPWLEFKDQTGNGTVDMRTFMIELDRVLPSRRHVAVDVGHFLAAPLRYLHVEKPTDFIWTAGFGSMGLGVAAAIGAACVRPEVPTVAVVGDGGFMMSLGEFNTAVRNDLDLIVIVLNDGSYGSEYHKFRLAGLETDLSLFNWPDLATLGSGLGGRGMVVRNLKNDLAELVKAIETRDRPLLIDVKLDPAVQIGYHD